MLAARGLGLLAALVLRAASFEIEALALARLVGKHEAGVVVQRRAAEAAGEDADRRQDEPRADLDERRAVLALRGDREVSGNRDATDGERGRASRESGRTGAALPVSNIALDHPIHDNRLVARVVGS